ncbi:MAG: hypothetical protein V7760_03935 [Marinobacter sp.]
MNFQSLEFVPLIWVFLTVAALMLVFCELGYQFGSHAKTRQDKEATASLGPMVGGLLGMLAFVLAFTFSMASSQHDLRKKNVLEEANLIGTAYLRADLLEERYEMEVKRLLKDYVNIRLAAANGSNIEIALKKSAEIHKLLWNKVSSAASEKPDTNTALVIQAINDVIDMHEKRVMGAFGNRVPISVWVALAAINALGMITLGTQVGHTGNRRLIALVPMALAFAVLVTLVVDLNRPLSGFIKVEQQSMINLQISMVFENR